MNDKKLLRSKNRVIAGVCAGWAEYLGWEITMVRVLYLILVDPQRRFPRDPGLYYFLDRNAEATSLKPVLLNC